jgi:hypothetical protein
MKIIKGTAIEWIIEIINSNIPLTIDIIETAKKIEKDNIINAFDNAKPNYGNHMSGEEYYQENFK